MTADVLSIIGALLEVLLPLLPACLSMHHGPFAQLHHDRRVLASSYCKRAGDSLCRLRRVGTYRVCQRDDALSALREKLKMTRNCILRAFCCDCLPDKGDQTILLLSQGLWLPIVVQTFSRQRRCIGYY